jgi:hypothetical protein
VESLVDRTRGHHVVGKGYRLDGQAGSDRSVQANVIYRDLYDDDRL